MSRRGRGGLRPRGPGSQQVQVSLLQQQHVLEVGDPDPVVLVLHISREEPCISAGLAGPAAML
eukprot:10007512-Alexandrium_andersonii.AAC.1